MSTSPPAASADEVARLDAFLAAHPQVDHIGLTITGYNNTPWLLEMVPVKRTRGLTVNHKAALIRSMVLPDLIIPGTLFPRQAKWVPDWRTLQVNPVDPTRATVICAYLEQHVLDARGPELHLADFSDAWDPRAALQRIERQAAAMGFALLVGYEIEFTIFPSAESEEPTRTPYTYDWNPATYRCPETALVAECSRQLQAAGIDVYAFHPEFDEAMTWEIALCPQTPARAADDWANALQILKEVAHAHGKLITCHPQPIPNADISVGQHVHVSLTRPDGTPAVPEHADHFLAGLLAHMEAYSAFQLSGVDSFHPCRRSTIGGGDVSWGDQRKSPIRRISKDRWEVRANDALCSVYLQLAAVLAAGLQGIAGQTPLEPEFYMPWSSHPRTRPEAWTNAKKRFIPDTLEGRLAALQADTEKPDGITPWLGMDLVKAYLHYKRAEAEYSGKLDPAERRKWLITHI